MHDFYFLDRTSLIERDGGVFECLDDIGGCSGGGGGGAPPYDTDDDGRGDGSVSTGDTIIASEGDSVCCIARAGTDAGGGTGVCGCRRACFSDREPDPDPELELGPGCPWGTSGGVGESSTNLRFLPPP